MPLAPLEAVPPFDFASVEILGRADLHFSISGPGLKEGDALSVSTFVDGQRKAHGIVEVSAGSAKASVDLLPLSEGEHTFLVVAVSSEILYTRQSFAKFVYSLPVLPKLKITSPLMGEEVGRGARSKAAIQCRSLLEQHSASDHRCHF